jgi:hypothetical protein
MSQWRGRRIGRNQTMPAAPRQNANAMSVAWRTVCDSAAEPDPEERVVIRDAGSISAQPASARTNEAGTRAIRRSNLSKPRRSSLWSSWSS